MSKTKDAVLIFLCIAVTLLASGAFLEAQYNKSLEYENRLQDSLIHHQQQKIDTVEAKFKNLLESMEYIDDVDVTMYNAVPEQTDDTPYETASGAIIDPDRASEHRWIAISRDLQQRWGGPLNFGDIVYLSGTDNYDGMYIVNDNMNPRYTDRIDILRTEGETEFAYIGDDVKLYRVQKAQYHDQYVSVDLNELNNYVEERQLAR